MASSYNYIFMGGGVNAQLLAIQMTALAHFAHAIVHCDSSVIATNSK